MKRREFIGLVSGAAAWPLVARAQQPAVRTIGWLSPTSLDTESDRSNVAAFRQGLSETGYVEGKNLTIEYRWAKGQYDQLPALATDLVRGQVGVIVTTGGPQTARAAQAATPTIPIVFVSGSDPVQDGLVKSFNRPGGNATGFHVFTTSLGPKRLELLCELIPEARVIAFLVKIRRSQLVALAARYKVPVMYEWSEFITVGGLVSYSTVRGDALLQVGIYVGRILNGAKPADLPVIQSTRFELVINLKTAKELGRTIPPCFPAPTK